MQRGGGRVYGSRSGEFGEPARRWTDVLLVVNVALFGLQLLTQEGLTVWGIKVGGQPCGTLAVLCAKPSFKDDPQLCASTEGRRNKAMEQSCYARARFAWLGLGHEPGPPSSCPHHGPAARPATALGSLHLLTLQPARACRSTR